MKLKSLILFLILPFLASAQVMTPELLWSLGRVSAVGISKDGSSLVYQVTTPDVPGNAFNSETFVLNLKSGEVKKNSEGKSLVVNSKISPDGKWKLTDKAVKVRKITGEDYYPKMAKSDAMIFDELNIRHWDTWEKGDHNHLFLVSVNGKDSIDLNKDEPFDTPTKPFGGGEDYVWNPDGKSVVYVSKKLNGNEYVKSTNTDLYEYNIATKATKNLTESNKGYDTNPTYSKGGMLSWLSMTRDGYESDKNDIKLMLNGIAVNITKDWDGTVNSFIWSDDNKTIYFTAAIKGTEQLFSVNVPAKGDSKTTVKQITSGVQNIAGLVGFANGRLIAGKTDMNHARELYAIDLKSGNLAQLTHVNDKVYSTLKMGKVESRMVETTDGKQMLVWVIYPPDFDASKKYPTLLYTQGGPQSALSQFYSFRWNFQLMAANGYIIVAPNRRGMPGYGVEWNEQISKDWGGQNMQDYLSAIDAVAKEPYVDKDRLGCVGASYGGYSAFYLEGIHEGRFKTFIAHDGPFNLKSMYGTTEELFFMNWDIGGPYWDKTNEVAQKTYNEYNPVNHVQDWDSPILIIQGGKDFRIPIGQGLEAFTATQLLGLKSRLLYLPEENHWVLSPQNAMVWQGEFFRWLKETL